jgi:predicted dehydrogenase
LPDVDVVAVAETDPEIRAATQRANLNTQAFSDYRELLEQPEIDAVVICLPNELHASAAISALQAGKHVYLEKPMAIDLDDGRRLIEAWRRSSGRVAMIGFNFRFNPLNQEMQRQVQNGRIGELIGGRSVLTSAAHRMPPWKTKRATGGGILLDLASHHIDLLRFWFDDNVVEVNASVQSHRVEADTATVELRMANGLLVQSLFSMSSIDDDRFEIYGRSGKLFVDRYNAWGVQFTGVQQGSIARRYLERVLSSLPRSRFAISKLLAPAREPSYLTALAHFVAAVRANRQTQPDFADGFHSLATVLAAEESASTGGHVVVPRLSE